MAHDDAAAVAAFARLGLIRTDMWPMVAAWLLDSGFDGPAIEGMASLDSGADAWDVDPLREELMREIGAPTMDEDRAASVVGATFAQVPALGPPRPGYHPLVRRLAAMAPYLDYPGGLIGECYHAEEFLDCGCHPDGAREADQLEHRLLTGVTLDLNPGLASALLVRLSDPAR